MTEQSTVDKPKTSSFSHQPLPVCACRKLVGFADKSTSVAPTQTQTRNASGTEIGTRYRYIDDTPLVPFNEKGTGSLVVGSGSSSSAAGAKTRSRSSNEYVLYSYGEPVAMTADGNTSYFGTDILGSVRNVTDKYGAVQSEYNYDVFGSPYLSNLDNEMSFGYCGKVYDNGTGLYDYGFRDYSPNQARFTTIDPIRDGANWFSYVVNDPVNYIDPFGLTATDQAYEVQPGDCLWKIAAQANNKDGGNRTAQQLAEQNNIANPDLIYPGDIIYIPSTPTPPAPAQPTPSVPTPAAPAPAAPAPTVPTPKVYGQVNPNAVKGQFVFFEVSKSAGTMNVYVSRYADTHQVDIVASIPVVTNVNKNNPDNSNPTDTNRRQGNGTNPTQVPNGIYEITAEKAPADANNRYGAPGHGLYVNVQQDLKVPKTRSDNFGEFVRDDGYEIHITDSFFTNGCIGIHYNKSSKESKKQAEYIQDYLNYLYRDMKSSKNKTFIEYKD